LNATGLREMKKLGKRKRSEERSGKAKGWRKNWKKKC